LVEFARISTFEEIETRNARVLSGEPYESPPDYGGGWRLLRTVYASIPADVDPDDPNPQFTYVDTRSWWESWLQSSSAETVELMQFWYKYPGVDAPTARTFVGSVEEAQLLFRNPAIEYLGE
jgi:hypothetical protein